MKLISSILFFSAFTSAFSQEWPWFFSETAFKNWLVEKNVKCLKYLSGDLNYEEVESTTGYPRLRKGITSYYFDGNGAIASMKIEEVEISLNQYTFESEENYSIMVKEILPTIPWPLTITDQSKFYDYGKSQLFPGIKTSMSRGAIAADGTIFTEYRRVEESTFPLPFAYEYRLKQEINFENGEIVSMTNYDFRGDFYIPYMAFTEFEKLNDSVSVLIETAHMEIYDHQTDTYVGKDTIINHPYYRKISKDKGLIELGVYVQDTIGKYCFIPLKKTHITKASHEYIRTTAQVCDHERQLTPISISDNYHDYRFLNHDEKLRVTIGEWYWYRYPCYNIEYYSNNAKITRTAYNFNKRTNEFSEKKIYSWDNNEWQLMSQETKTKTGYLQNYYAPGLKKPVYQITISSDANNNPVFTKTANEKEEILFRISGDSIYLTRDENFYGHFLVEYE